MYVIRFHESFLISMLDYNRRDHIVARLDQEQELQDLSKRFNTAQQQNETLKNIPNNLSLSEVDFADSVVRSNKKKLQRIAQELERELELLTP